ncbi:hypothetical protein RB195_023147 [Necator americanus]|uniref:Uncharacterized protein n=1 Tax=Necator americanus TaxID=51031 RepID=A0ABR1EI12_NECAM
MVADEKTGLERVRINDIFMDLLCRRNHHILVLQMRKGGFQPPVDRADTAEVLTDCDTPACKIWNSENGCILYELLLKIERIRPPNKAGQQECNGFFGKATLWRCRRPELAQAQFSHLRPFVHEGGIREDRVPSPRLTLAKTVAQVENEVDNISCIEDKLNPRECMFC